MLKMLRVLLLSCRYLLPPSWCKNSHPHHPLFPSPPAPNFAPLLLLFTPVQILSVQAIVLANLCVSYIMTSQNEEAEELMRKIEKEEEQLAYQDPNKQIFHLCIVNLVIGTLYCAKGNFEFGISRIIKSLEPYNRKLGADTWFYAKRCFLALIDTLAKHMILLKDSTYAEIMVRRKGGKGFGVHQCEVPAFTSATALSSFRMH
mmetsp:Transcript_46996/g.121334  ORF Transcript_46996/g.121334 Transcript_46996/m.121334 type:complete len:203 (-) Transcript_46996:539-1147(-)